jgi:hypothetical protein
MYYYKHDKQIKNNKKITAETHNFDVENSSNIEGETTGISQQNFTILESVYKRCGLSYNLINPNWWLTRGIYMWR